MIVYRIAWWVTAAALAVPALAVVTVAGQGVRMIATALMVASVAVMMAFVVCEAPADQWRWSRRVARWAGAWTVAGFALVHTWGGTGLLLATLLLLGWPTLVEAGRAQYLGWASRLAVGPLESLELRDLVRRWEWTTAEMVRGGLSVPRRAALAEERRRLLDEVQLRDPARFQQWTRQVLPDRRPERQRRPGSRG